MMVSSSFSHIKGVWRLLDVGLRQFAQLQIKKSSVCYFLHEGPRLRRGSKMMKIYITNWASPKWNNQCGVGIWLKAEKEI